MMTLADPSHALARGLALIRTQFKVPSTFPTDVLAAADEAAKRKLDDHVDRMDRPFITLDPESSTDLDQAFTIDSSGNDLLLHYAIADVAWFVDDGGVIDAEAWRRGASQYLPDGKAPLYPPAIGEGAASLLPDGPRPAVIFTTRILPDGNVRLDSVERAIIRSRAKLAYDKVRDEDLPPQFGELAERIRDAENRRGAQRVDPPEQEVAALPGGDFELTYRLRLQSEDRNAALSLATNLAVADAFFAHHTGLFRVMAAPDERAIKRLRLTASAFGLNWPKQQPLADFQVGLDPSDPRRAAFMLAIRRAGTGAAYMPYQDGILPWHAAVAATYAHATAPLRRLADRYVVRAALAIAHGEPVPEQVSEAFVRLPPVMARADMLSGQIDRAVIDLAEAVMLRNRTGEIFCAVVTDTDDRGARIQLCELPIVAHVPIDGLSPGDEVDLKLVSADPEQRVVRFERNDAKPGQ